MMLLFAEFCVGKNCPHCGDWLRHGCTSSCGNSSTYHIFIIIFFSIRSPCTNLRFQKEAVEASSEDALPDEFNYDEVVNESDFPAAVVVGDHLNIFLDALKKDPPNLISSVGSIVPLGRTRLQVCSID